MTQPITQAATQATKPPVITFKVGDSVELKSYPTWMTVLALYTNGRVLCAWIDGKQKLHRATFPVEAIERAVLRR